jgi:hypothetical protein
VGFVEKKLFTPETGEIEDVVTIDDDSKSFENNTEEDVYVAQRVRSGEKLVKFSDKKRKNKMPWEFNMVNKKDLYSYIFVLGMAETESHMLLGMCTMMNYECKVCDIDTGQYISTNELAKLFHWGKTKVKETLNTLEDKELIVRFKFSNRKCVMINPDIIYQGQSENIDELRNEFRRYIACKNK